MTKNAGFTLFEIIAVLVLTGIIAVFSSMFLSSGINMFCFSRNNSDTALKTQIALNRIGLELKNISNVTIIPDSSISYENDDSNLPGSRKISFDSSGEKIILTVDNKSYTLLDHVTSLKLSESLRLNDGSAYLAKINIIVTFEVNDVSKKIDTEICPRVSL